MELTFAQGQGEVLFHSSVRINYFVEEAYFSPTCVSFYFPVKNQWLGAGEIARQREALVVLAENLDSSLSIHVMT